MDLDTAGLHKDAFRLHGKPLTFVRYASQDGALEFLHDVCNSEHGLGVLKGQSLSGKTTVVKQFIEELPAATAVAIIDCKDLDTSGFLTSILAQFGYELDAPTINEQVNFLQVFLVQNTSTDRAPLLFIENAHEINPVTVHCLCQLIKTRFHHQAAIRVVLMSNRSLDEVIMKSVGSGQQEVSEYSLAPMTIAETEAYINFKLCAAGCDDPARIVPWFLRDEIFEESKGLPGLIDRQILLRLQDADELPLPSLRHNMPLAEQPSLGLVEERIPASEVSRKPEDVPVLFITLNGKTLQQVRLDQAKTLIGRSDLNEITIYSACVSRYHAMFLRRDEETLLIDLNSSNGVLVNSERVMSRVIQHDDVITLGNHRIKLNDPGSRQRGKTDQSPMDDTESMKVLNDTRRVKARTATRAV